MIDVGISHTCAVMDDGTLYCWGLNANYQLGDGTNTFRSTPIASNLPNGISASLVTTGEGHTCILTNASTIYCMGANSDGQLGDSTTVSRNSFTETHWNRNNSRILCITQMDSNRMPNFRYLVGEQYSMTSTQIPQGISLNQVTSSIDYDGNYPIDSNITVFANSTDNSFSLSISMKSFEHNKREGQINSFSFDSGFVTSSKTPISVRSGYHHGCLIDYDHKMKCWGINQFGNNGYGSTTTQNANPINVDHNYMTESKKMDVEFTRFVQ